MKKIQMKDFFHGFLLGSALLAPGLSIATLALILNIYEKLLDGVNDFFSPKFKRSLPFLIPLGIGAVIAVGLSSRLISFAYDYFPGQTYSFFLGLIVASVPLLWKSSEARAKFGKGHFIALGAVALVIGVLGLITPMETDYLGGALSFLDMARLFATGALTIAAMLLPGLSGALVLMLMGTHSMLTHAISNLDLAVLGVAALGGVVGLIAFSRLIKYLMGHYLNMVNAISIGMVLGSVFVVMPDFYLNGWEILSSLVFFAIGYGLVALLDLKNLKTTGRDKKNVSEPV